MHYTIIIIVICNTCYFWIFFRYRYEFLSNNSTHFLLKFHLKLKLIINTVECIITGENAQNILGIRDFIFTNRLIFRWPQIFFSFPGVKAIYFKYKMVKHLSSVSTLKLKKKIQKAELISLACERLFYLLVHSRDKVVEAKIARSINSYDTLLNVDL